MAVGNNEKLPDKDPKSKQMYTKNSGLPTYSDACKVSIRDVNEHNIANSATCEK